MVAKKPTIVTPAVDREAIRRIYAGKGIQEAYLEVLNECQFPAHRPSQFDLWGANGGK